jgi:hypothetical protein
MAFFKKLRLLEFLLLWPQFKFFPSLKGCVLEESKRAVNILVLFIT